MVLCECGGHVKGLEKYECMSWKVCIRGSRIVGEGFG